MVSGRIGVAAANREAEFRGQNELVATPLEELAQHRFTGAVGVEIGGVDEVPAPARVGFEDAPALFQVAAKPPLLPKCHGPQAQGRDAQSATTEQQVVIELHLFLHISSTGCPNMLIFL